MAGRNLLDIFSKYQPSERTAAWMLTATDIKLRADKERRMIEVSAAFPALVEKRALYTAEAEIAKAYELSQVRILPHYAAELFDQSYIPALIEETQRIGIVARGFFNSYRGTLEDGVLTIELPYIDESLLLMEAGKTPQVIEGIIRSEFGLSVKVRICHSPELAASYSFRGVEEELAEWDARLKQSSAEYDRAQESRRAAGPSEAAAPAPVNSNPDARRMMSLLGEVEDAVFEDGICRVGKRVFDISEPQFAIGAAFPLDIQFDHVVLRLVCPVHAEPLAVVFDDLFALCPYLIEIMMVLLICSGSGILNFGKCYAVKVLFENCVHLFGEFAVAV